jgi:hypothetical protein
MPYQNSDRTATTRHQPPMADAEIDALLIDDEPDDFLDCEIAAICDSLADYRNS